MTNTYSIEQIDIAACKTSGNFPCLDEHEHTQNWFASFKAKLTEPEWKPSYLGQVIYYQGFQRYAKGYLDNHVLRPLTPFEAGHEPMQHLVDALEELKVRSGKHETWVSDFIDGELAKHKELMK